MRQLHQNKRATFLGSPPRDLSKHVQNKALLFGRFQSRCRPCCPSYRHSSRFGCLPTALAAAPNAARDIAFRTSSQTTFFISDRPCRETWEQTSPPVGRRLRKGTLPIAAYTRNPNDFSYVRMLPKVGFGKNLSNTQLRVGPNGSKHRPQWHICCAMMPCRSQLFQETQMILHTFGCNRKSVLLKTQLILQTFGWGVNFRFHR